MPLDLGSIAGAVSGGSNIFDIGINSVLQKQQNRRNQKWQEKMYNRQRADALADWSLQNQYNSPVAQMGRLKDAKLNPNLIYGTGVQASGLSGAVRSSSQGSYRGEAPQVNIGSSMSAFIDARMKQQQIDTMKSVVAVNAARQANILADTINKGAQKGLIDVTAAQRAFKLGLDKSMVGITVDTASAQLDKLKAEKDRIVTETMYRMHEDIRREMLSRATFAEKMQHVALMIAQEFATREGAGLTMDQREKVAAEIQNLIKDGTIKEQEIMKRNGDIDFQVLHNVLKSLPNIFLPLR